MMATSVSGILCDCPVLQKTGQEYLEKTKSNSAVTVDNYTVKEKSQEN
jgi:hypothetical protein